MSDLDAYGMTPEERAAFEQSCLSSCQPNVFDCLPGETRYRWRDVSRDANVWAACAKQYREQLKAQARDATFASEMEHRRQVAEVKELHTEVERLQKRLGARRKASAERVRYLGELYSWHLEERQAEVERLRAELEDSRRELEERMEYMRRGLKGGA